MSIKKDINIIESVPFFMFPLSEFPLIGEIRISSVKSDYPIFHVNVLLMKEKHVPDLLIHISHLFSCSNLSFFSQSWEGRELLNFTYICMNNP